MDGLLRLPTASDSGTRCRLSRRRSPSHQMKLTKLSAAPTLAPQAALGRRCRRMPAPARMDAGTASQLIPGVVRTCRRATMMGILLAMAVSGVALQDPSPRTGETFRLVASEDPGMVPACYLRRILV